MCTHASLQVDKDIVMEAVKQDGYALRYAHASLQSDKDIVMEAVKQDNRALQCAHASLLEAVKQDGRAVEYADASLQADKDIVVVARSEGVEPTVGHGEIFRCFRPKQRTLRQALGILPR
jgi:hypothetical protein